MKTLEVLGALPMKGSSSQDVLDLQKQLQRVGLNPGPADGAFGSKTEAAVKEAQGFLGLAKTGIVTDELLMKLAATKSGAFVIYTPASPSPKTASTDMVVADGGSSVVARAKAAVGKAKLVLFPEGAPIYKQPGVYLGVALLGFSALFLFAGKGAKAKLAGLAGGTRRSYKPGTRVRISEGSGHWSNKKGVIVERRSVPMRRDGSGIPDLTGHYSAVDWSREVAVKLDNGELITMFKNRVMPLDGLCGRGGCR